MAETTDGKAAQTRALIAFLVLVAVLTVPFWLLDLVGDSMPSWFPDNLPTSALMVVVPAIAAAILIGRRDGRAGLGRWLRRVVDAARIHGPVRWAFTLLILPLVYLSAWLVMLLFDVSMPDPRITWSTVALLLLLYFVAATAEELGWTAYATDALLPRWGVWATGAVLGLAWAVWHIPGYISGGNGAWWVFWQCAYTLVLRMLITWTYTWTDRSVFAAITLHALSNVSWNLFPVNGSHYDPMYTTAVMAVVLAVAALAARGRAPGHDPALSLRGG